jgi:hypothetical protein
MRDAARPAVADSQETSGGALVTDSQETDGEGVGHGFARFLEEKVRRGSGLADWGLRVGSGAQGGKSPLAYPPSPAGAGAGWARWSRIRKRCGRRVGNGFAKD